MGIAELWQILPSDERVPFPVFIARFLEKHKRPPRFAIDAYMFMFWSSLSNGDDIPDPEKERIDTRNFMAKLWYLVQNNVSFVVVFDGKFKPEKLRNGIIPEIPGSASYDEILKSFLSLHSSDYSEGSNVIENLKKILLRNRMDWVQAPAEGEAECARLQRLGVVDYVISDDSDTLVFGATGVLRWFNRVKYHKEDGEKVMSSTDYYVTPVHMSHVTELTNLTKNHLIMIAVLRGGDYSTGAENIGITRAKELALCGTTMLSNLPRKTLQDFGSFPDLTSMFINTFLESEKANVIMSDPYYGRKSELDRHESLASFNDFFNEFLIQEGKKVFGRATNFKKKTQIQDYYAMLYLFPLVNTKVFKFSPHSTTFGELEPVTADLTSVKIDCEVSRFNFVVSPRIIGKSIIKDEVQSFVQYVDLMIDKTPLPRERKYNLKAFLLKFLRDKKFWDLIQLARIKELDGVPMAVLKFNRVKLNEFVYYTRKDLDLDLEVVEDKASEVSEEKLPGVSEINEESEDSKLPEPKEDENKLISVVVPLECVSYVSREFVKVFKPQPSRKSPTKKKPPPQKTTLDKIWPGLSPTRGEKCIDQSNISPTPLRRNGAERKLKIPPIMFDDKLDKMQNNPMKVDDLSFKSTGALKIDQSPTLKTPAKKQNRRRKGQKPELLPGQTTITTFIQSKRIGTLQSPLFVPSDDENEEKDDVYQFMKDSLGFGPELRGPIAESEERHLSSQESSPEKRHRKEMRLSPETSPIKARSERKVPW